MEEDQFLVAFKLLVAFFGVDGFAIADPRLDQILERYLAVAPDSYAMVYSSKQQHLLHKMYQGGENVIRDNSILRMNRWIQCGPDGTAGTGSIRLAANLTEAITGELICRLQGGISHAVDLAWKPTGIVPHKEALFAQMLNTAVQRGLNQYRSTHPQSAMASRFPQPTIAPAPTHHGSSNAPVPTHQSSIPADESSLLVSDISRPTAEAHTQFHSYSPPSHTQRLSKIDQGRHDTGGASPTTSALIENLSTKTRRQQLEMQGILRPDQFAAKHPKSSMLAYNVRYLQHLWKAATVIPASRPFCKQAHNILAAWTGRSMNLQPLQPSDTQFQYVPTETPTSVPPPGLQMSTSSSGGRAVDKDNNYTKPGQAVNTREQDNNNANAGPPRFLDRNAGKAQEQVLSSAVTPRAAVTLKPRVIGQQTQSPTGLRRGIDPGFITHARQRSRSPRVGLSPHRNDYRERSYVVDDAMSCRRDEETGFYFYDGGNDVVDGTTTYNRHDAYNHRNKTLQDINEAIVQANSPIDWESELHDLQTGESNTRFQFIAPKQHPSHSIASPIGTPVNATRTPSGPDYPTSIMQSLSNFDFLDEECTNCGAHTTGLDLGCRQGADGKLYCDSYFTAWYSTFSWSSHK